MMCGHMDVVPVKIKVRKEGNMLHGRGASDAKAPLIAMMFAAASIKDNQGTVTVSYTHLTLPTKRIV